LNLLFREYATAVGGRYRGTPGPIPSPTNAEVTLRALPTSALDSILSLRLLVAWAGEASRLGWWKTQLLDPDAGLDLLGRLAPRTGALAAWELTHAAAIAVDSTRREAMAGGERAITLFHLGVEVDEAVTDRLRSLKMSGTGLSPLLPATGERFDASTLTTRLSSLADVDVEATPSGRRVKGEVPSSPELRAKKLAAALVPFGPEYSMPFFGGRP
jgi:hypothetical protein